MKRAFLPEARTIENFPWNAPRVLLHLVMRRPAWRGSLEAVRAGLAIINRLTALQVREEEAVKEGGDGVHDAARFFDMTNREHELLSAELRLVDANGSVTTIDSPEMNRYYLLCVEGILDAKEAPPEA